MDIIGALQKEEAKLERQLTAVQGAITALSPNGASAKRTMSAAVRARISGAAKARRALIKAGKAKKTK
jgi:hypothetical protein